MIIVDMNQVAISSLMVQLNLLLDTVPNESMLRHLILNSLKSIKNKFQKKYGRLVIAADSGQSWRKTVFPYYKANRKKMRDSSHLDWNEIFSIIDKIRNEIKDHFSYPVIRIPDAEADDIIGTLVYTYNSVEPIMIVSGDKDFIQLQKFENVKQYDPTRDRYPSSDNPDLFLKEHIIRGDSGDGIPNYLSSGDCLVLGVRQKSIRQVKLDEWLKQEPEEFCDENTKYNYDRNKLLIDLSNTPKDIQENILKEYTSQENKKNHELFNYFVKNKLVNLMDSIHQF